MNQQKLSAIILKKQPYLEGDEIITLFTKEQGKVRCLAKSVKSHKSKLQQKLQALFLVEIIVTTGKMPKIIGAEPIKVFSALRENLTGLKMAFYAIELVMKLTADEHKNEHLFNLLAEFLEFLNSSAEQKILNLGLAKFKIEIMEVSGLGIRLPQNISSNQGLFLSPSTGSFLAQSQGDALGFNKTSIEVFIKIKQSTFKDLTGLGKYTDIQEMQDALSKFVVYQLERRVKSEGYLRQD